MSPLDVKIDCRDVPRHAGQKSNKLELDDVFNGKKTDYPNLFMYANQTYMNVKYILLFTEVIYSTLLIYNAVIDVRLLFTSFVQRTTVL